MASLEEEVERIGEILIEEGLILQEDLEKALQEGAVKSSPLAAILQKMVCVRRNELAAFIGTDYQFPQAANLGELKPSNSVLESISAELAVKHNALPVARAGGILFVVMGQPSVEASRDIRKATGLRLKVLQAPMEAVKQAVQDLYLRQPISVTANEPEVATGKDEDDAVPLVSSSGDETAVTAPPMKGTAAPVEAVPAKMSATKISLDEYRESERFQIFMRTISDWEGNYVTGRPVQAIKIA